jgi:hypothetical protein
VRRQLSGSEAGHSVCAACPVGTHAPAWGGGPKYIKGEAVSVYRLKAGTTTINRWEASTIYQAHTAGTLLCVGGVRVLEGTGERGTGGGGRVVWCVCICTWPEHGVVLTYGVSLWGADGGGRLSSGGGGGRLIHGQNMAYTRDFNCPLSDLLFALMHNASGGGPI